MESYLVWWIALIGLLILAAFFSAAETGISSVNHIRLKNLAADGDKKAKKALSIVGDFDRSLSSILIGSTIANLTMSSVSTVLFIKLFGDTGPLIGTVIATATLLTFGEVLPKSYAKQNSDKVALVTATPLYVMNFALYPLVKFFLLLRRLMNKFLGTKDVPQTSITEEELKCMIDEIEHQGGLDKDESELVQLALDFDETTVEEILTPRVDMVAIELHETAENIEKILLSESFSRVPVYDKSIDNIVGVLLEREYFKSKISNKEFDIKEKLQKALFVPQWSKISDVLKELQKNKTHIAIVTDEHGGTMGIVTLEDVLEELVGEIWDEYDEVGQNITKIDDRTYEVEGSMSIKSMMEYFHFSTRRFASEGNTVGGWAMERLNKILEVGDNFDYGHLTLTVKEIDDQRATKLIVTLRDVDND